MTDFDDLLRYDALEQAERSTGKSWQEDDFTGRLGLALHLQHVELKRQELELRDDTHYSSPFWNTLRIFTDLGFEAVHGHLFPSATQAHASDRFVILWRPDGVLGTLESYGDATNNTKIFYNWRANEDAEDRYALMSSGHWVDDRILVGDHDAREGLRHTLGKLEAAGTFLPFWVERPFLWLLDYSQSKGPNYDYKTINDELIARLPILVREAITP